MRMKRLSSFYPQLSFFQSTLLPFTGVHMSVNRAHKVHFYPLFRVMEDHVYLRFIIIIFLILFLRISSSNLFFGVLILPGPEPLKNGRDSRHSRRVHVADTLSNTFMIMAIDTPSMKYESLQLTQNSFYIHNQVWVVLELRKNGTATHLPRRSCPNTPPNSFLHHRT